MFVLLRVVGADAHIGHKKVIRQDDVGIIPCKSGALEVKPFLLRSLY